jgi:hypothetical protein
MARLNADELSWKVTVRTAPAPNQRRERTEVKRLRELEREAKAQGKLDLLDRARLEVDTHETRIALLLSIHREPVEIWNWHAVLSGLDPCVPLHSSPKELDERLAACGDARAVDQGALERLRIDDRRAVEEVLADHARSLEVCRGRRAIAARVLSADLDAFTAAIAQWNPFRELEELGVTVKPEFYSREAVHCGITVRGPEIIPQEMKTLTSTGKLSVKPMAKGRFHEIYQDYVCGCVLRTASEVFGFLPVQAALVTASVGFIDPATGQFDVRPVLSVGFTRAGFASLALDNVDPSDAIEGFVHRGDAKASRKTGSFVPVEPLGLEDLALSSSTSGRFEDALAKLRRTRDEVRDHAKTLTARLRSAHHTSSAEA